MRSFAEPTCKNLLRPPLVLGVSFPGLLLLVVLVMAIQMVGQGSQIGNAVAGVAVIVGYTALRVLVRYGVRGWEEKFLFYIEQKLNRSTSASRIELHRTDFSVHAPDTLDEAELINTKQAMEDRFRQLKSAERLTLVCDLGRDGTVIRETKTPLTVSLSGVDFEQMTCGVWSQGVHVYTLIQLPVVSDPLWVSTILSPIGTEATVVVSVRGMDAKAIKAQIEGSRKRSSRLSGFSQVDDEITFEESTRVLQGLSRGDDCIVELAMIVISHEPLDLDSRYFFKEKDTRLPTLSTLGLRQRFHRHHVVRAVTAADLVPNVLDPYESGPDILTTPRGNALYFDPQDPRLEALHWLVVGASGSGKSFFTGVVLRRMIERGVPMSVIFVDHNRSFRRAVRSDGGEYVEPQSLAELNESIPHLMSELDVPGKVVGVELSDLAIAEKKEATQVLLRAIEKFLRRRSSLHPVYVVMDECWNFLRDEPILVQRFFREFRKLNGAAVAITQSLSDFLTDESGRSIFQNAPVRILLRQGEDLSPYQGVLGLNGVELGLLRHLRQKKGAFSECLIKTPFLSRVGRLYPTIEEYELFRTDNIRSEIIGLRRTLDTMPGGAGCECN